MKSLRELYRIGCGPSSSHTMGPRAAAERYLREHPQAKAFRVTLYGSLAATGKGHLTDWAILQVLGQERTEIVWRPDIVSPFHPNGMKFEVLEKAGIFEDAWTVFSVGGGALAEAGHNELEAARVEHERVACDTRCSVVGLGKAAVDDHQATFRLDGAFAACRAHGHVSVNNVSVAVLHAEVVKEHVAHLRRVA